MSRTAQSPQVCVWPVADLATQLFTAGEAANGVHSLPCMCDTGAISEPEVIAQFMTLLVAGLGVSYTLDRSG